LKGAAGVDRVLAGAVLWLPNGGCYKIPDPVEERPLTPQRRPLIALLTLIALVLGQSAATLHALKHYGNRDDGAGNPAQHVQLCLECVSFAPLASPHGGSALLLFAATLALRVFVRSPDRAPLPSRPRPAFRSRAPPR
jgi:hypothetical protein